MPPPIRQLAGEMLHNPVSIERERQIGPPTGITQAVYPVAQELKSALLVALLRRGDIKQALVFTRTKHRANRLADYLVREGVKADRIHGNRSQGQRTAALAAFKAGRVPVLVATDIAARGIDVEALGHVVNFDVPLATEDYIHRIGRTGRAEVTGEAFTFASPQEQTEIAAIERVIGRKLPRVTVPDFDYAARPDTRLEIPLAQRIAEIRARKAHRASAASREGSTPGPCRADAAAAIGRAGQASGIGRTTPAAGTRRTGPVEVNSPRTVTAVPASGSVPAAIGASASRDRARPGERGVRPSASSGRRLPLDRSRRAHRRARPQRRGQVHAAEGAFRRARFPTPASCGARPARASRASRRTRTRWMRPAIRRCSRPLRADSASFAISCARTTRPPRAWLTTTATRPSPSSGGCSTSSKSATAGASSSASRPCSRSSPWTPTPSCRRCRVAGGAACCWRRRSSPSRRCCCSTSRPTTSTSTRSCGSRIFSKPTTAPSSS